MYKYLPITSNIHEMMVMMNSLPVCTTVFDKNAQLIEINQSALNFLEIKTIDDFKTKRLRILNDCNYLLTIIQELRTGKIIQNKNYLLKYPDSNFAMISFSACMLSEFSDLFLFQFFELPTSYTTLSKQEYTSSKVFQKINKVQESNY